MGGEQGRGQEKEGEKMRRKGTICCGCLCLGQTFILENHLCNKEKTLSSLQFAANVYIYISDQEIKTYGLFAQLHGLSNFNNSLCLSVLVREIFNFLWHKRVLKVDLGGSNYRLRFKTQIKMWLSPAATFCHSPFRIIPKCTTPIKKYLLSKSITFFVMLLIYTDKEVLSGKKVELLPPLSVCCAVGM